MPNEVTIPAPVTTTRRRPVDVGFGNTGCGSLLLRIKRSPAGTGKLLGGVELKSFRAYSRFQLSRPRSCLEHGAVKRGDSHVGCWDVIVLGGALSGASTALLLQRADPNLRVLVLEKSSRFTRRVGEATVEISAYFLGRVLGLTRHLNESHLVKQGMRFWFSNPETLTLAECGEIGGKYQVRLPAYQLDRAVLDEEVLRLAALEGAEVRRETRVTRVVLKRGGLQRVEFHDKAGDHAAEGRWVVDATGFAAMLSRQEGWYRANAEHPTSSVWARWRGVKDLDGRELAVKFPEWAAASYGLRSTATNHLMGPGWWAWIIPLKGGDVSVGVVYDQRRVIFPAGSSLNQRLKAFLCAHPVGAELLASAECIEGDTHARSNLSYSSDRYFGDGHALVGDAGAFLDPLYSPGMDWLSFSVSTAVALILKERCGEAIDELASRADRDFRQSYDRWFSAVYREKYEYMGEMDLMRTAFGMDLGLYYLGVVSQPFKRGTIALLEPVFTTPPSVPVWRLMCLYNRRLASMARSRRTRGVLGRENKGRRHLMGGFTLEASSALLVARSLMWWVRLEFIEGWRTWFVRGKKPQKQPVSPVVPPAIGSAVAKG
jgi:flavin-dependent dehydrogenase